MLVLFTPFTLSPLASTVLGIWVADKYALNELMISDLNESIF